MTNPVLPTTICPLGTTSLSGVAFRGEQLHTVDTKEGYLLAVTLSTQQTRILNPEHWQDFVGVTGIAIAEDNLWFTTQEGIYFCPLDSLNSPDFQPQLFLQLFYPANGVAVINSTVYVTCQKTGYIYVFSRDKKQEITRFRAPGIGIENITVKDEYIWISDSIEQTVYCLDRATGETAFSLITPFESPTGLAFYTDSTTGKETLYVSYSYQEPSIRDNPNADPNYELSSTWRTFIHPLYFHYNPEKRYALSNGYLIELSYIEELAPLYSVDLKEVAWRIALPVDTPRQKVLKVEAVGLDYQEEVEDGQKIAVFKFDQLTGNERYIFGWKALIQVWGIKYRLTPRDCENLPPLPPEIQSTYLVDNDDLSMGTEIIQRAAREAIGTETNLLRQVYNIRNYVYDRLSYGIKPHIDTPDIALRRGVGSCGEYLGVLLALSRLNGIASRTVGRYKCPAYALRRGIPLEPDYNHVWMEFYLPGFGWLPMESNPDDLFEGGPYPNRFFMGLAWYHAEMAKNIPFEQIFSAGVKVEKTQVSIGDLAINHVQFTILEELDPSQQGHPA
jgi:transglutaminase-like putative cysteine protease